MARIQPSELGGTFERIIERRLRSLKIPRAKTLSQDLSGLLLDEVPSEAYEPKEAWEQGFLFFHGEVEEEHVREVQDDILNAHLNAKHDVPLTLYLSSFGGCVFSGLALTSTIQDVRRRGRKVNIHIQGCAMSMGSLIAQVGDLRTIEPQGWLMIHEVSDVMAGKTSRLRDEVEYQERLEAQIFSLYSERTGKPVSYWQKKMHRREWYISAEEALAEGLVDEIAVTPRYPRTRRKKAV